MIYYDSRDWASNILHFFTSNVLKVLLTYVLVIGLVTTMITVLLIDIVHWKVNIPPGIFYLHGIMLALLLIFRTHTAFGKWKEGSRQWASLINHSRNLAQVFHLALGAEDRQSRERFGQQIVNYGIALNRHLRNATDKTTGLLGLEREEKQLYQNKHHLPNHMIRQLHQLLNGLWTAKALSADHHQLLNKKLAALSDIAGNCEQIRQTPLPFSFSTFIKTGIILYCLAIPFGFIGSLGYLVIPAVMFTSFLILGLEILSEEIEDPFGAECNDLPLSEFNRSVERDIYEILELDHKVMPLEQPKAYEKRY